MTIPLYASNSHPLLLFVLQQTIVGHSLGAKAAMICALQHPQCMSRLAVIDASPTQYSHSHQHLLKAMLEMQQNGVLQQLKSRAAVAHHLKTEYEFNANDSAFVASALRDPKATPGQPLAWAVNVPAVLQHEHEVHHWPTEEVQGLHYTDPCLFIGGSESSRLAEANHSAVYNYFPFARIEMLEGGHFVHKQQTPATLELLNEFLR
eukprot:TRINITY_DN66228_c8_g2_i3.p1 TRINITY_DN66228_c8_g2~~TRINITY_DN66228_c8_g2_i3.p1  ORF type:complete len:206 (-),score=17.53 TRINITY_DN66228_c8_g2_i3:604-1221(-)